MPGCDPGHRGLRAPRSLCRCHRISIARMGGPRALPLCDCRAKVARAGVAGWLGGRHRRRPAGSPLDAAVALSYAAVASSCTDGSEFVSDVTVPDGTHLAPNTLFIKTWRLRNTGTCTWDASYRLTFLSGDRLSGPRSAPLDEPVGSGEQAEVSVMLITPESAGTYRGQWTIFALDGRPFGTRPYVMIRVP